MAAGDEATQREVIRQIFPRGHFGHAEAAILHRLPGGQTHQRLMLGGHQVEAPLFDGDMACIDGAGNHLADPPDMHLIVAIARVGGLRFEKAFYFTWRLEPARGIAFQGFGDDGGQRLIPHQHLAVTGHPLKAVADGRACHPIAVHRPGAHAVGGLLGVLLALVLRDRGQQVFDQDGIRILAELDGGAFQLAACLAQQIAQIPMAANVAGEAADIVDDDDVAAAALRFQGLEHGLHGGPVGAAAAGIIAEDLDNVIALVSSIFAAAGFLAAQPVTLAHLLGAGNAGVDDGSLQRRLLHGSGALL